MIDSTTLNSYPATGSSDAASNRPRFHMRRDPDDRTAGSIPVWENPQSTQGGNAAQSGSFENAMGYTDVEPAAGSNGVTQDSEAFGFGDLIDIVNPLHHIPLVSAVYEGITGDTIKPTGRIVGGAIFGGLAGAAAGIANVIIEEETGKDMTGNVVAFVTQGELPQAKRATMSPEQNLDQAAQLAFNDITAEPLPDMALGIQPQNARPIEPMPQTEYERYTFSAGDDDRMAGTMVRRKTASPNNNNAVNPFPRTLLADPVSINLAVIRTDQLAEITQVHLSPMKFND